MKTLKTVSIGLFFLCPLLLWAQNQKGDFLLNGLASYATGGSFKSKTEAEYFLSDRWSISFSQQSNILFSNSSRNSSDLYGITGRYYLSRLTDKANWFIQLQTQFGLDVYKFTFREIETRYVNQIHWTALGLGFNKPISSNIYLSGFLNGNLIRTKQDNAGFLTQRFEHLGLSGQIAYKLLLPIKKSEHDAYQIIHFQKGQKFFNGRGRLLSLGYASNTPFEIELEGNLGFFLNNNWLWGIDSRLGYFEEGSIDAAVYLEFAPFIRYYIPMLSKQWRIFGAAQITFVNHFDRGDFDPFYTPSLNVGTNFFFSPEAALEGSIGYGVRFDTFGYYDQALSAKLGFRFFL